MLRSWDGLDLKVVLKESHKDKDKKQQKTHRFSLRTKRNNRETLPPPPPDILQTAHVCFLRQRKKNPKQTNKTYMCCGLKAPPHPPPRLTPPPPPCHPAGLVWQVLNVDSWHPGPLRRDAWIQTWHKHLSLCACAPLVGHSAPRAGSLGERWCGAGGGEMSRTTETSGLGGGHFATVCLHTHLSASGGERREGEGERGGEGDGESARVRDWAVKCLHACVCVWCREREKTSSRDASPSINSQDSLSTWVRPHPASSNPHKPNRSQAEHEEMLAGCFLKKKFQAEGQKNNNNKKKEIPAASRLERQQRRHLGARINLTTNSLRATRPFQIAKGQRAPALNVRGRPLKSN